MITFSSRQVTIALVVLLVLLTNDSVMGKPVGKMVPPKAKTKILQLGRSHGIPLICKAVIAPDDDEGGVKITLQFASRRGSKETVISTPAILSFPDGVRVKAVDFIHTGHKQVLVEGCYGAVTTYIYDYDGKNLRPIYSRDEGRVGVEPTWSWRYRWQLKEDWSISQFSDEDNLGIGYVIGTRFKDADNPGIGYDIGASILRYLHWNGKQFAPDHPGETRIVSRIHAHRSIHTPNRGNRPIHRRITAAATPFATSLFKFGIQRGIQDAKQGVDMIHDISIDPPTALLCMSMGDSLPYRDYPGPQNFVKDIAACSKDWQAAYIEAFVSGYKGGYKEYENRPSKYR